MWKSTHTSGCVPSHLKSAYASGYVRSSEECLESKKMTFDTITEFWKSGI
jgi:hypothetical protein